MPTKNRSLKGISDLPDFRAMIRERLGKLGRTKHWLAEKLDGEVGRASIYEYLRDGTKADDRRDIGSDSLSKILDTLDAEEKRQSKAR